MRTALLVNFNVPVLRLGLRRLTNKLSLHGPSIGGESSGAQEGGELGRPEVGRHRRCGGMDRVSTLSGSATRAWRSPEDEHLTGARLPDPDLATKIRIPERLVPEMR